jgi:hypothetical protein
MNVNCVSAARLCKKPFAFATTLDGLKVVPKSRSASSTAATVASRSSQDALYAEAADSYGAALERLARAYDSHVTHAK